MTMPPNDRDPIHRTPADYVGPDERWNLLTLVLGALVLGIAGFLLFGDNFGGPDRARITDTTPNTPVAK